jgi:hypothetical protein
MVSKKEILFASLIMLIFFIVAVAGIRLVLDSIRIGPGLPPPEIMSKWYIPGDSRRSEEPCTSHFPKIFSYCNMANVSGGKFINIWYFDNQSGFLKGEDSLYRYLNENGNVSQQELNIVTGVQEDNKAIETSNFTVKDMKDWKRQDIFWCMRDPSLKCEKIFYSLLRNQGND